MSRFATDETETSISAEIADGEPTEQELARARVLMGELLRQLQKFDYLINGYKAAEQHIQAVIATGTTIHTTQGNILGNRIESDYVLDGYRLYDMQPPDDPEYADASSSYIFRTFTTVGRVICREMTAVIDHEGCIDYLQFHQTGEAYDGAAVPHYELIINRLTRLRPRDAIIHGRHFTAELTDPSTEKFQSMHEDWKKSGMEALQSMKEERKREADQNRRANNKRKREERKRDAKEWNDHVAKKEREKEEKRKKRKVVKKLTAEEKKANADRAKLVAENEKKALDAFYEARQRRYNEKIAKEQEKRKDDLKKLSKPHVLSPPDKRKIKIWRKQQQDEEHKILKVQQLQEQRKKKKAHK